MIVDFRLIADCGLSKTRGEHRDQHRTAECDLFYKICFKSICAGRARIHQAPCKQTVQIKSIVEIAQYDAQTWQRIR